MIVREDHALGFPCIHILSIHLLTLWSYHIDTHNQHLVSCPHVLGKTLLDPLTYMPIRYLNHQATTTPKLVAMAIKLYELTMRP